MRWMVLGICVAAAMAGSAARAANEPVTPELIRLHDDLRLTPEQDGAWHDYVLAIAPDPQSVARHKAAQDLMPLVATPRRIALIEANMTQDSLDFRRQGAAVNAFYAKLTPEQQKTFDRDTLPASGNGGDDRRP